MTPPPQWYKVDHSTGRDLSVRRQHQPSYLPRVALRVWVRGLIAVPDHKKAVKVAWLSFLVLCCTTAGALGHALVIEVIEYRKNREPVDAKYRR